MRTLLEGLLNQTMPPREIIITDGGSTDATAEIIEEFIDLVRPHSIVSALMRRKVWEDVGGFPEYLRSAEDLLFMRRVEEAKFKIARTSRAIVYWNIQPDCGRTFKRFVVYSRNNIRAGLFAEWQGAIFIYYALLAASAFMVFFLGPRAFLIPLVLWLLLLTARATKALRRNRKNYPAGPARNLLRLGLLAPIIAMLDAAAFTGSVSWLLRDKFRLTGSRGEDDARE